MVSDRQFFFKWKKRIGEVKKGLIVQALERTKNNKTQAARSCRSAVILFGNR
jgi:hypothetical protein